MATVAIENVSKFFGPVHALKGIDIDIDDGEFVALVGPSGCGKSTLLRLIAGLADISGGEISIGGQVVNELTPRERNIAMVFQNYALYPHMSVTDNLSFSLRLKKEEKSVVQKAVSKAADTLGLDTLLERFPGQLSGGQRQRVAMGRALVRDSKVFLFDEPLSNLDAQLRVQMRSEIKQLHQNLKNTMIYVTHDQIEAMTMADRIVVMRDGIIEQVGEPLELYDRPENTFVASFIGSPTMNLISGRAVKRETRWQFETESGALLPMPSQTPQFSEGTGLVYGIRPENLSPAEEGLEGKIILVEPTGSDINLIVNFSGTSLHCSSRQRTKYSPGDVINLSIDTEYTHLFNVDNGKRIN